MYNMLVKHLFELDYRPRMLLKTHTHTHSTHTKTQKSSKQKSQSGVLPVTLALKRWRQVDPWSSLARHSSLNY